MLGRSFRTVQQNFSAVSCNSVTTAVRQQQFSIKLRSARVSVMTRAAAFRFCNRANRLDRLDRQTGQRTDSVWRTVLQTVAQKRFALCYQTVVHLSCLSVTLVHCGQTVGRIKVKLGMHVGLGPGHIVLDGDPAPPQKGAESPKFSAHVYCGQTAAWIKMPLGTEVGLGSDDIVLHEDPAPTPHKRGHSPQFSAHFYCAQTAGCIKMPLGMEVGLSPGDFVFDGTQSPSPKKRRSPSPIFGPFLLWSNG